MLDISAALIRNIIFHQFRVDSEFSIINDSALEIRDEDQEAVLKKIFLKPFTQVAETYEFWHPVDLSHNSLSELCGQMQSGSDFVNRSQTMFRHLQSVSKHPNIKDGDVFVMQLQDLFFKGQPRDGIAICKVEQKESFLEPAQDGNIDFRKGIGPQKLDKALLIIFTPETETILLIDNGGKETEYWKNDFAKVRLMNDEINSTNQIMSMAKTFITQQIPHEYEVEKHDQIDLLNKSAAYFKENETFEKSAFEQEVFGDPDVISSFRGYDAACRQEMDIQPLDAFEISKKAVQKQSKVFKSVLKLDKNFSIYIHGDKSLIEKGTDDTGKKYYKIFYEEEK